MPNLGYPLAPVSWGNLTEWCRILAGIVNSLRDGKLNPVGSTTLAAGAASTTLSDRRIGRDTVVLLMPATANASAEFANGTIYQTYPNASNEAAVLNHANNAQTDRTFAYVLLG